MRLFAWVIQEGITDSERVKVIHLKLLEQLLNDFGHIFINVFFSSALLIEKHCSFSPSL